MTVKLGDICSFQSGGTPSKTNADYFFGDIPWITTVALNGQVIGKTAAVDWITGKAIEESAAKIVPARSIMVGTRVGVGKVAINEIPMSTSQDIISLVGINESLWNKEFLCKFIQSKETYLKSQARGATIKGIKIDVLASLDIPDVPFDSQKEIVAALDKVQNILAARRSQLCALDDLIKARFVEMFGDPVHNPVKLPTLPMTEVCEIIDGDRGKNYPTQEEFFDEGYCLFLNAKNVTKQGFNFSDCMFITKEKDATLRKGKLQRGDVVLTTRGTLGNLAFYTEEIPFENMRINSGMVILRMNRAILDETFFIEQFRMQLDDIKARIANGSAQPQLPISTMNKIRLLMPDLEEQRRFADFVLQVDKSKSVIQKSLDETQLLFDSLMQKYFR